jgi:hypothetical protein
MRLLVLLTTVGLVGACSPDGGGGGSSADLEQRPTTTAIG